MCSITFWMIKWVISGWTKVFSAALVVCGGNTALAIAGALGPHPQAQKSRESRSCFTARTATRPQLKACSLLAQWRSLCSYHGGTSVKTAKAHVGAGKKEEKGSGQREESYTGEHRASFFRMARAKIKRRLQGWRGPRVSADAIVSNIGMVSLSLCACSYFHCVSHSLRSPVC